MNSNGKIPLVDLMTPHEKLEAELVSVLKTAFKTERFLGGPVVEGSQAIGSPHVSA